MGKGGPRIDLLAHDIGDLAVEALTVGSLEGSWQRPGWLPPGASRAVHLIPIGWAHPFRAGTLRLTEQDLWTDMGSYGQGTGGFSAKAVATASSDRSPARPTDAKKRIEDRRRRSCME